MEHGLALDNLKVHYYAMFARQSANFKSASYNYSIQSELDTNPQSRFIYCNAGTALEKAGSNQVAAISWNNII